MASKKLDDLDPAFKIQVFEFLARAVEARLDVVIIETRRTEEAHRANVLAGRSWTKHSKHIDGLAIDVGLAARLKEKNWSPEHPDWQRLGTVGQRCGLKWGGTWEKTPDLVHFEKILF